MSVLDLGQNFLGAHLQSDDNQQIVLIYPTEPSNLERFDLQNVLSAIDRAGPAHYVEGSQPSFPIEEVELCEVVYSVKVKLNGEQITLMLALPYGDPADCDITIAFFEDKHLNYRHIEQLVYSSDDHELFYMFYASNFGILGIAFRNNNIDPFIFLSGDLLVDAQIGQLTRTSAIAI